jgi:hypothetical protein
MKRLPLFIVSLLISLITFARPVSEKVLKAFAALYPTETKVTWYEVNGNYEVFMDHQTEKCRVQFDEDGHVVNVRRDYGADILCPYIKAKLLERYEGKKIFGITEITNDGGLVYYVILEDNKHYYHVRSDASGNMMLEEKLDKANS